MVGAASGASEARVRERICSWAASTTRSGVKPNFVCSSFSGAEAPNVLMPTIAPEKPT
jgi:hypothetical protein